MRSAATGRHEEGDRDRRRGGPVAERLDRLAAELARAAPGTASMIEAQSAKAELFRIRALDMANMGAGLKFNANYGATRGAT